MSVTGLPVTGGDWLFDSPLDSSHALLGPWRKLAQEPLDDLRVVAHNLAADGRVAPDMRTHWCTRWAGTIDAEGVGLHDALNRAWPSEFVRPPSEVRFSGGSVRMPPTRRLVHVDPLERVLARATASTMGRADVELALQDELGGGPWLPSPKLADRLPLGALGAALQSLPITGLQAVVDVIYSALSPMRPFWWATLADDVQDYRADAVALVSALGLGNYEDGDWLLVFEYTASDAGLLWRPTTPEAGGYPFHHPSPAMEKVGWTMPLRPSELMCTEILHHALPPAAAAQFVAQILPLRSRSWTHAQVYADLMISRQRHRESLRKGFADPATKAWLDRHAARA